jgi:hypothetical protein
MFHAESQARAEARQLARERGVYMTVLYSHHTREFKVVDPWLARMADRLTWSTIFVARPRGGSRASA